MALIIPNATDVNGSKFAALDQAEPDSLDFQILGDRSSGVLSGCVVTAVVGDLSKPRTVNVATGKVVVQGVVYTVNTINIDLPTPPASSTYRFDVVLVRVDKIAGTSSVIVVSGDSSNTNPAYPQTYDRVSGIPDSSRHIDLSTDVVLAAVYRDNSAAISAKYLVDKRVNTQSTTIGRGDAVPTNDFGVDGDFYYKNTSGSTGSGVYVKRDGAWVELLLQSNSATTNPVGAIIMWPGATNPAPVTGWKECNGELLPTPNSASDQYWELYQVIGTSYNTGGEVGQFRLPNLQNKFPYGGDSTNVSTSGGSSQVLISVNNLPAHSHGLNNHTHSIGEHVHPIPHTHTGSTVGAGAHDHSGGTQNGYTGGIVIRLSEYIAGTYNAGIGYLAGFSATSDGIIDGLNTSSAGMQVHWAPTTSAVGTHTHDVTLNFTGNSGSPINAQFTGAPNPTSGSTSTTESTGGNSPLSILPPFMRMRWFIRVK